MHPIANDIINDLGYNDVNSESVFLIKIFWLKSEYEIQIISKLYARIIEEVIESNLSYFFASYT